MAAIATALLSNVFEKSEAKKALTPWWDKLENYCVYGLIMLGKHQNWYSFYAQKICVFFILISYMFLGVIAFPTAMYHGSPLHCAFCTKDICPKHITEQMVIHTNIFLP